jgi:hypothetical protein
MISRRQVAGVNTMISDIQKLRDACSGYPRQSITRAVHAALHDSMLSELEREELAALLAAWLTDEASVSESPPLSATAIRRIIAELRRRAH